MESETSAELLVGSAKVLARYDISKMSLHRRMKDLDLNFPKPIDIRGRHYWRLGELRAWERQRAARVAS
jgi:predicted DNA-binding transcriptional regulator AlpA